MSKILANFPHKKANLVEITQEKKNTIFQKFPELLLLFNKGENSLKKTHYSERAQEKCKTG
jgi:hemoglobin-like flavoprotein